MSDTHSGCWNNSSTRVQRSRQAGAKNSDVASSPLSTHLHLTQTDMRAEKV